MPSRRATKHSEEARCDAAVTAQSHRTACEDYGDLEKDEDALPSVDSDNKSHPRPRGPLQVFTQISSSVLPSPSDEEEIQAFIPHYRILPILSGVTIPFCILLDIPGLLTTHWYIRKGSLTATTLQPNPPWLVVGIALSMLCAVLANVCLVVRFLERCIKTMTVLCILFLSIHDMFNIVALTKFRATKDDYTYGQAFWMTLCSTIVSMFTNVTLIIDLIRTPDFSRSGSGLTRRQRSLVIIIIGLCCYVILGALVNSLLLDLTFIDGLYFTIVTIETIGFGDIVPHSTSSRIFIYFYTTFGVINLAFVVGYVRETVLEGLDFGYRRRLLEIQEKRRASRHRRRAEKRWRHAIVWRLRERHAPVWVPKRTKDHNSVLSILMSSFRSVKLRILSTTSRSIHQGHGRHGMQLNLWTLPPCQLEAAALEAGAPLESLLPKGFYETYDQDPYYRTADVKHHALPSWFVVHPIYRRDKDTTQPPTHHRLGTMAAILTKLSLAIHESGGAPFLDVHCVQNTSAAGLAKAAQDSSCLRTKDIGDYRADVEGTEKMAYYTRSSLSWLWLLTFWMGGAAIFKATEGWTYGSAIYFCFISFTTIGYGDLAPTTPAGRSVFVAWALIGVATMTLFISVVSEAYTIRYKSILHRHSSKRGCRKYRERDKIELSEKVQRTGSSTKVKFVLDKREKTDAVTDELQPASATVDDDTTLAVATTSRLNARAQRSQRSPEILLQQILTETRSIQQYIQLIDNLDEHSAEVERFVDGVVWSLIDDVMDRRKLADGTKKDILKDGESRQILMLLGITRSLKELVIISEQAVAAAQEWARIVPTLEQETDQGKVDVVV